MLTEFTIMDSKQALLKILLSKFIYFFLFISLSAVFIFYCAPTCCLPMWQNLAGVTKFIFISNNPKQNKEQRQENNFDVGSSWYTVKCLKVWVVSSPSATENQKLPRRFSWWAAVHPRTLCRSCPIPMGGSRTSSSAHSGWLAAGRHTGGQRSQ